MPTEAEVICQVSELGEDLRDDNTEFKSREELLLKSRIGNMGKSGTEGRVTGVTAVQSLCSVSSKKDGAGEEGSTFIERSRYAKGGSAPSTTLCTAFNFGLEGRSGIVERVQRAEGGDSCVRSVGGRGLINFIERW